MTETPGTSEIIEPEPAAGIQEERKEDLRQPTMMNMGSLVVNKVMG